MTMAALFIAQALNIELTSTARTYETHSQNVIGDLPGATRPEEIIVLGSHMDSWDLGTGAIDDGAGGAITVAAAKAIADSGRITSTRLDPSHPPRGTTCQWHRRLNAEARFDGG